MSELLERVADVADAVLWPAAQDVDRAPIIPRSHVDALADLGLFGQAAPPELGGLGLSPPDTRRMLRLIGSGCAATGFAFAQHQGLVGALVRTANAGLRERWLAPLCRRTLAGIAFAHVRRSGPPALTATPLDGGAWLIEGEAPWVTSWGLAEVFLVAAVAPDDRLLWFVVPGAEAPGLTASGPLALAVLSATATVRLRFDGYRVAEADVVEIVDRGPWSVGDRRAAARPNPLCLGVGDRALAQLAGAEPSAAEALRPWWEGVSARAEAAALLVDRQQGDPADLAAARAESIAGVQRLTTALLAAVGGGGAILTHPAQRLAREALFYVVQAQNADGRRATLASLTA
ncbi:MAG: acyl-CoA dehydrogenase family protein [Acidimicrobiales bacterium]